MFCPVYKSIVVAPIICFKQMEMESQNQQLYLLIKIKGRLSGGPHILKIAEISKFEIIPYIGLKYRIFENGPDFGLFWRILCFLVQNHI